MSKSTPATRALDEARVSYSIHNYEYQTNAERIGLQAAEALGESPDRVLKTLMARIDGMPVCVVIRSDREVAMKKLARALDGKKAEMMTPADAERITGYRVGGISPFGQKRLVPVVFDKSALRNTLVYMNGGARGLQLKLDPRSAQTALNAIWADVSA